MSGKDLEKCEKVKSEKAKCTVLSIKSYPKNSQYSCKGHKDD